MKPEPAHAVECNEWCRDQYPRLLGTLTLYLGDRWVAEELAQDTLVQYVSLLAVQVTAPDVTAISATVAARSSDAAPVENGWAVIAVEWSPEGPPIPNVSDEITLSAIHADGRLTAERADGEGRDPEGC